MAGADRVVEALLPHLPSEHEYVVYVVAGKGGPAILPRNVRLVEVPSVGGKHLRAASYFALCAIHFAATRQAHVAHIHNSDFGLFCPVLKLHRKASLLGTFHGDPYLRDKWGAPAKAALRLSEWLFVICCDALTSVAASKRIRGRSVDFIPNGIAVDDGADESAWCFEAEELLAQVGLAGGDYVLFACGRLDRTKGLHHALQAYSELKTEKPLLVIGDFDHDSAYSDRIRLQAASDRRVILHPHLLSRRALMEVVRRAAVFVFPSEIEAMSMMLLEAIGCETLVVCSDIDENMAVVGSDYPLRFRTRDPVELRRTLERALGLDSVERREIVTSLRGVRDSFDWIRIAGRYARLYSQLSGREPGVSSVIG